MILKKSELKTIIREVIEESKQGTIRLYRGLEQKLDNNYDLNSTDAPTGYSTWTDNEDLAKQYAGDNGYVYYIDLPKNMIGYTVIDESPKSETYGDRYLYYFNNKAAGLNGVNGKEYLVYNNHDFFDDYNINMIE